MKMDMQELLARMDAWVKEMNTNHEKAEAKAKANHKEMMAKIDAETEAIGAETKALRDKGWKPTGKATEKKQRG
jgi:hypothetical protein